MGYTAVDDELVGLDNLGGNHILDYRHPVYIV